jgi:uncharacterized membrane protein YbhN (UPF0104 family)
LSSEFLKKKLEGVEWNFERKRIFWSFPLTLLVWVGLIAYFWLAINSFGYQVNFLEAIAPSLGTSVASLLPINGIGSFGVFEYGFSAFYQQDNSLNLAFAIHLHVISISFILSLLSLIFLSFKKLTQKN